MIIPSYFINLDRAEGRREHMEEQAKRSGLTLSRISAVDGSTLPHEELQRWNPPAASRRGLTAGEIGCFLSHRKAWTAIAEGDACYGAVFEDDVFLSDSSNDVLRDCRWVPEGTDLIKTETFMRKVFLKSPFLHAPAGRSLARLAYQHYGAGGYIMSKRCANHFLHATKTFDIAVDLAMFSPKSLVLPSLKILQLSPAICVQQMQSQQHLQPNRIEASALEESRTLAKGAAATGFKMFLKQVGKSIENVCRGLRQHTRATLTESRWSVVEFR